MSTYIPHTPNQGPGDPLFNQAHQSSTAVESLQGSTNPEPETSCKPECQSDPEKSEPQTDNSVQSGTPINLPALLSNENPAIRVRLHRRIDRYADAFDKAVSNSIQVQRDTVGVLEEAYGLWDMCRLNDEAKALFDDKCRQLSLEVSDKAGEFILYLKFVQAYWEQERQPTKEAREAARQLVQRNNRHSAALTGLKIHLIKLNGEHTPYTDGTVTELLTNKNTEFGSVEAVVQFAREQSRKLSVDEKINDVSMDGQEGDDSQEVLISEDERACASSLHRKKHSGLELSLKTWLNGRPIKYRVLSTKIDEIQGLGILPSTPEESEAFAQNDPNKIT
jgi:hypothetical protein